MIIQPLKILAAILITGIILLSGCTAPQEDEDEPTGLTELRFGYQPSTHQIAYMAADAKGWWLEDLEPYDITSTKDYLFPTGAPEMLAMLAGEIDVAYVGSTPPLSAIDQGLKAKIVAGAQTQGSDLVLANDLPYESPQDLVGLTIATFPPGTLQDTVLRKWLLDNDIDPMENVTILGMGGAEAITSLASGNVDAVFLPHPNPTVIESEGYARVVVQSGEMWPDHACCVVLVTQELIDEHPDIVEQIIRTHIKATQYIIDNPDEAAQIFSDDIGVPYNISSQSIQDWDGEWVSDPNIELDTALEYAKVQYDLGYTDKLLTQDDLFDLSFYNKVIAEMGEE
ncbi:MAG: ABC transporter substrate-binding protein [Methanosarcinales archaeon]|nr:ABC transporter substrate-binding protein [Methanosarcinales archaeon]